MICKTIIVLVSSTVFSLLVLWVLSYVAPFEQCMASIDNKGQIGIEVRNGWFFIQMCNVCDEERVSFANPDFRSPHLRVTLSQWYVPGCVGYTSVAERFDADGWTTTSLGCTGSYDRPQAGSVWRSRYLEIKIILLVAIVLSIYPAITFINGP